mgnify:CR=1 FL=1
MGFVALTAISTSGECRAAGADVDLERQIGQMMITGFLGRETGHPWFKALLGQVERGEIGGVLFLRRNITTLGRVRSLNELHCVASTRKAAGFPA